MKKFNLKDLTLKNIWQIFLVVALPIICVAGASPLPYNMRQPLIYAVAIFFVLVFVFSDIKIKFNFISSVFFILLAYIGISIIYSYDPQSTIRLFILYACAFTLLFIDMPRAYFLKILTIFYVVCTVVAFSIIVSAVIPNCMLNYFWFIVNPGHSPEITRFISNELAVGAYSGFAREKAEAAYIMNVGTAILLAKYFSDGKLEKKDLFMLLVFLVALMLTGKRTLFIIAIAAFAVFMLLSDLRGKTFKTISVIIIAVCVLFVIMMFIPKAANIFERFLDKENVESLGNRDSLWVYMTMMIAEFPIFGAGMGSYNQYAFEHGLRVADNKWFANGHNCYLQVMSEMGAVGSAIFLLFVIAAFVYTVNSIRKFRNDRDGRYMSFFALYIQIMMIIYSLTGNPLYSRQILFVWIFSIGMVLYLNKTVESNIDANRKILNTEKHKI